MADQQPGALSEWLELMLAEIARRQDEMQAGREEQSARAAAGTQSRLPSQPQQPAPAPAPAPSEREAAQVTQASHPAAAAATGRTSKRASTA